MVAVVVKVFAAVLVVVVALVGTRVRVSAETHHVLGPALDVGSWLSGRVFRVGDKIWFNCSGTEDTTMVELQGPEEFHSCDLTNPINMYTDPVSHVELEKEGIRYFTSGNLESCKNGLKLPVPIYGTPPPFGPFTPQNPSPKYVPPPEPVCPPPPTFGPPPAPPSPATYLSGLSLVLFGGLLICYLGM